LLKNGADASIIDRHRKSAVDYASENADLRYTDAYELLLAATHAETTEANTIANTPEQITKPVAMSDEDFLQLCESGTAQEVEVAIKEGVNVNARGEDGTTALMIWTEHDQDGYSFISPGNRLVADDEVLSIRGIVIGDNVRVRDGPSTRDRIRAQLTNGASVDVTGRFASSEERYYWFRIRRAEEIGWIYGEFLQVESTDSEVEGAILQQTTQPSSVSVMSDEAFIGLCVSGTAQELEAAIKNGANVNAKYENGWTALIWVASDNSEVISILLENGADVNVRTEGGVTALMAAARSNSNPEIISIFLENGANLNDRDEDGRTALVVAAAHNPNPEVISVLLKNGANVNARFENGVTALMGAAMGNPNPQVISVLLENGAEVNARAKGGVTALMLAANVNPNPEVISILLKNGADAHARDEGGYRAIDHASENENLTGTQAYWELNDASY